MSKLSAEKWQAIASDLAEGGRVQALVTKHQCSGHTIGAVRKELLKAGFKATGGKPVKRIETISDQIASRRQEQEIKTLKEEKKNLLDELARAQDVRAGVLGIASEPLHAPVYRPAYHSASGHNETAILAISDVHMGEVVDLEVMDGMNSYDERIAKARLERLHVAAADLLTRHRAGRAPERLIVWHGGDLITGEIHEELAKTNDLPNFPAVKSVASSLVSGLQHLREMLPDTSIEVHSTPGNHGRLSHRPEFKRFVVDSFDTLVADYVEFGLKQVGVDIPVYRPASGDALVDIYGRNFLFTHGDQIGTGGGQGNLGPVAPITRGFHRVIQEMMMRGIEVHKVICGHYHTPLEPENGYANASVIGPNEYSRRKLRARPHPAQQMLLTVHPQHGVTMKRMINVGAPEEGSLYRAPKTRQTAEP